MRGPRSQYTRATIAVLVLALCWPMAVSFAAAAGAPAQKACCMRMSHACHSDNQSGDAFQAVCRTCGWCHALPNGRAHLAAASILFSYTARHAQGVVQAPSRLPAASIPLHASRAPPQTPHLM